VEKTQAYANNQRALNFSNDIHLLDERATFYFRAASAALAVVLLFAILPSRIGGKRI
jgi:hypothetical protein